MIQSNENSFRASFGLLERVKADAPNAWQQLSTLYGPLVYHWCRRSGLRSQDAAVVVQAVFIVLSTRIYSFSFQCGHTGNTFRSWLWTIARDRVSNHFQLKKVRPQSTDNPTLGEWEPVDFDEPSSPAGVNGLMSRALDLIRDDFEYSTWLAFTKTAIELAPSSAVADELGMTANEVRKAKAKVLYRLREELHGLVE